MVSSGGSSDDSGASGILGDASFDPAWSVGGDTGQPGVLSGALNPPPWTPQDNSLNMIVDPATMKTIDFAGTDQPQSAGSPGPGTVSDLQTVHLPDGVPAPVTGSDPAGMTLSDQGKSFMQSWEKGPDGGPALSPYPSPEGGAPTIGWGHKVQKGEDFSGGITSGQADQIFSDDIAGAQKRVQQNVQVPLTQNQYDALVSLSYNDPQALTPNSKHPSTLLDQLNNYDYGGAGDQMLLWNQGGSPKKAMPGLVDRREKENSMFVDGVYTNHN